MKTNNPATIPAIREKMSRSVSKRWRSNPTGHEAIAIGALLARGYPFDFQYQIGPHIVDFALPYAQVIVELDGRSHESRERRGSDAKRDRAIAALGWHIIRVRQSYSTSAFVARLLDAVETACGPPPELSEYRMALGKRKAIEHK